MFQLHCVTIIFSCYIAVVVAGNVAGYHYEKPSLSSTLVERPSNLGHGHNFGVLPTVRPMPPVPSLPPMPTPRQKEPFIQTQTIYQTHPVVTLKPLHSSYVSPPSSNVGRIAQQYQSAFIEQHSTISPITAEPVDTVFSSPLPAFGSNLANPAPVAAQPLRVPFGKQALITYPSAVGADGSYEANGRQLKQYAVIEIIDNDIEQNNQPMLRSPFFENYRAHAEARNVAPTPDPLFGVQLGSIANAAILGQQAQFPPRAANDAVALGSGGLGFIRLANGNVYLGSGSLGYVSGQQHTKEILEARTRSGAPQPDALHFGHGPLNVSNRFNKFSYRFK